MKIHCFIFWTWFSWHLTLASRLRVEPAKMTHFKTLGKMAGTVAYGHLVFSTNVTHHFTMMRNLCKVADQLAYGVRIETRIRVIGRELSQICHSHLERIEERRLLWSEPTSRLTTNHMPKKRSVPVEECHHLEPLLGPPRTTRVKRQFLVGAALALSAIAAATALFTGYQLHQIIDTVNKNQETTIRHLQDLDNRMAISERSIRVLNRTVAEIGAAMYTQAELLTYQEDCFRLSLAMDIVQDDSSRVLGAYNELSHHRLSPDLIRVQPTEAALQDMRRTMRKQGYELGVKRVNDLFKCEASHVLYPNGSLYIIVHVPASKINTDMQLYELMRVPITIPGGNVEEDPLVIRANPSQPILGVSDDDETYRALGRHEFAQCTNFAGTYFCPNHNVYRRDIGAHCTYNIFANRAIDIINTCFWSVFDNPHFAQQSSENTFLVYFHKETEIKLVCPGGIEHDTLKGLVTLTIPAECKLYSPTYILEGVSSFSVNVDEIMPIELNFTLLLDTAELGLDDLRKALKDLKLVGSSKGITFKNIRDEYVQLKHFYSWNWGVRGAVVVATVMVIILVLLHVRKRWKKHRSPPNPPPRANSTVINLSTNLGTPSKTFETKPRDSPRPSPRPLGARPKTSMRMSELLGKSDGINDYDDPPPADSL